MRHKHAHTHTVSMRKYDIYIYMYIYIHTSVCVKMFSYIYIHTDKYIDIYVHIHIQRYVRIHLCIHMYTYPGHIVSEWESWLFCQDSELLWVLRLALRRQEGPGSGPEASGLQLGRLQQAPKSFPNLRALFWGSSCEEFSGFGSISKQAPKSWNMDAGCLMVFFSSLLGLGLEDGHVPTSWRLIL